MKKRNILGVGVCATDYEEVCGVVRQAALEARPLTLSALAVHGVMTGALDKVHRERLNAIDVIVPDGQPVRWGINLLFKDGLKDRVCGPELMLHLCRMCEADGLSVGFYGNRAQLLQEMSDQLLREFPNLKIAFTIPSRFARVGRNEQSAIASQIQASGADVVFVGLGCPRQEVWLYENRDKLDRPMIAVGAAFDFHAKRLPQAPLWMRKYGLEWCYRLVQEPARLWRRYLLLNPLYLLMLTAQKLRLRSYNPGRTDGSVTYEGYA